MDIDEDKLFDDTYMVLTGKKTQEQILEEEHSLYLLFDPQRTMILILTSVVTTL